MPTGTIVTNVRDIVAAVLGLYNSTKHEIAFLVPPSFLSLAGALGTFESAKRFIKSGGVVRAITTISRANVEEAQMRLDIGEDLRHSEVLSEVFLFVGDQQHSISSMNIGVREYTLDTPVTAFWSEDPTYAEYLLTSFENAWSQAVPAEEQIRELLRQG
ncbi:MAG: hypothetical protein ACXV5I_09510 [Halobacteriota archaeon]